MYHLTWIGRAGTHSLVCIGAVSTVP